MRAWPAPREPNPSPGASATRASSRIRSTVTPSGSRQPDEERPFRPRARDRRDDAVAPCFVERTPLLDALLRARQRRHGRLLQRDEDAGAHVVVQQLQPPHDLRVADDEAEPPSGHAVGLRHREQLDADLLRARLGEEARRPPPVEDEVAVGEVVQHDGSGALRVCDRLRERPVGYRRRGRVRGVVQVDRRHVAGRRAEVRPWLDRQRREPCARERDGRRSSPGSRDRGGGSSSRARRRRARSRPAPS